MSEGIHILNLDIQNSNNISTKKKAKHKLGNIDHQTEDQLQKSAKLGSQSNHNTHITYSPKHIHKEPIISPSKKNKEGKYLLTSSITNPLEKKRYLFSNDRVELPKYLTNNCLLNNKTTYSDNTILKLRNMKASRDFDQLMVKLKEDNDIFKGSFVNNNKGLNSFFTKLENKPERYSPCNALKKKIEEKLFFEKEDNEFIKKAANSINDKVGQSVDLNKTTMINTSRRNSLNDIMTKNKLKFLQKRLEANDHEQVIANIYKNDIDTTIDNIVINNSPENIYQSKVQQDTMTSSNVTMTTLLNTSN